MENGDYLLMGTDRNTNLKEIARHSKHDADAMDQYEFDMAQVCQALKPLDGRGTAQPVRQRSCRRAAAGRSRQADEVAARPRAAELHPLAHRQLRRLPRRLLRERHHQGLVVVVEHHRQQGRAAVAGLGFGAAVPQPRRARRPLRFMGLPQGRQRRVHPGAGACRAGVRRRDRRRHPGQPRHHQQRQGQPAWPWPTAPS